MLLFMHQLSWKFWMISMTDDSSFSWCVHAFSNWLFYQLVKPLSSKSGVICMDTNCSICYEEWTDKIFNVSACWIFSISPFMKGISRGCEVVIIFNINAQNQKKIIVCAGKYNLKPTDKSEHRSLNFLGLNWRSEWIVLFRGLILNLSFTYM